MRLLKTCENKSLRNTTFRKLKTELTRIQHIQDMYEQTQIAYWFNWQPPTLNEVENTSIANFNALFSQLPVKAKYCPVKTAKLGTREIQY